MNKQTKQRWSAQDTVKLIKLVEEHGHKWCLFENEFPERSRKAINKHYNRITQIHDGLKPEDKSTIHGLLGKENDFEIIDWEHVQQSLSHERPIEAIQQYYRNFIQPDLIRGKWTKEGTQQLMDLVKEHGRNWELISEKIGTHSQQDCSLKYKSMMNTRNSEKGKFSKEEDETLLDAVNKYGKNFNKIKANITSGRTVDQLRRRFYYFLNPEIDKSPWTQEEHQQLFYLYDKLKDVEQVKKKMSSKRSLADLYDRLKRPALL